MKLWTYNLWPNNLLKTKPLLSPRPLVLLTSPLFLWKLAIFRKCSSNFQDCITWLLNTTSEYPKRFILKIDCFFHIQNLFYSHAHKCQFSYLLIWHGHAIMMTKWWRSNEVRSKKITRHFICFIKNNYLTSFDRYSLFWTDFVTFFIL